MRPEPSSAEALARMRRQARADTAPERLLRSELHRRGLRYRLHRPVLPGSRRRHDLVFTHARVVVEVRGCYWHACPVHGTLPKENGEWWAAKLARNVERDLDSERQLRAQGWGVVIVWEHDDPVVAADRVEQMVRRRT